jgi:SAM-dependent methyltransferase
MNPSGDRAWLIEEISKRAPWYQRIAFPEYGVTTTDDPAGVVNDGAYDNLFPGMDPADAPRLRPVPKYERLRPYLPKVAGKSVLDVGSSCGFFAFEFCRLEASRVTGLEISDRNVEKARFCAEVLGLRQVRFVAGDVGRYSEVHDIVWGASLLEHFFFPFYYLARMLCLAQEQFVLETHQYVKDDEERIARLDLDPRISTTAGSHAFHLSRRLFLDYLQMLGVPESCIEERIFYDDSFVRRLLLCVDTREFQRSRRTHSYLRPLDGIG